jgi:hypothetical protein
MSKHNALVGCCIRVNNIFTVQFPSEYDKIEFENKYTTNKIKLNGFGFNRYSSIRLLKKHKAIAILTFIIPKTRKFP